MDITTFENRLNIGNSGAEELRHILESESFTVSTTGQEVWLNQEVRNSIRHNHTDLTVRAVRYKPDLLAFRRDFPLTYFEAKVNTTSDTPNFAIEKACYDENLSLAQKGERCVIAFREVNKTWYANFVQQLIVARDMSQQRHRARGSTTPFLLITKRSTMPLLDFLNY
jgi:hypothetical protein